MTRVLFINQANTGEITKVIFHQVPAPSRHSRGHLRVVTRLRKGFARLARRATE